MDISEFASVGAKIAELSLRLKQGRADLEVAQKAVTSLEDELRPLVVEHAKMVATLVGEAGVSLASEMPAGVVLSPNTSGIVVPGRETSAQEAARASLRKQLLRYLDNAPEGVSAIDVADALKVDVVLVRQIMGDMARGR